jgi:hypothetical protein
MSKYKKYFRTEHYITHLKKQPEHIQNVYAVLFASVITLFLGALILYFDYGFWRDTYSRTEVIQEEKKSVDTGDPMVTISSPGSMIQDFFSEAKEKIQNINLEKPSSLLEAKESYTKEK